MLMGEKPWILLNASFPFELIKGFLYNRLLNGGIECVECTFALRYGLLITCGHKSLRFGGGEFVKLRNLLCDKYYY